MAQPPNNQPWWMSYVGLVVGGAIVALVVLGWKALTDKQATAGDSGPKVTHVDTNRVTNSAWLSDFVEWFDGVAEAHRQAPIIIGTYDIPPAGGGHLDAEFADVMTPLWPLQHCTESAGRVANARQATKAWQRRVRSLVLSACAHFERGYYHIVDAQLSGDPIYIYRSKKEMNAAVGPANRAATLVRAHARGKP